MMPACGEPVVILGVFEPVLGVSNPIGVTAPLGGRLGGTGILRSSGDPGMVFAGKSGIRIRLASLL